MRTALKNILLPVDFSINSEVAIKKAIELADEDSTIHLLYIEQFSQTIFPVSSEGFLFQIPDPALDSSIELKMNEYKRILLDTGKINNVTVWYVIGNPVQKIIGDKAKQLSVDLVIIGKHSHHSILPLLNTVTPSFLSFCTKIPVLTVKPGALDNNLKTLVVPVTGIATRNKLGMIAAICGKYKITVHLVTFTNGRYKPDGFYNMVLAQYYQLLGTLNTVIEYVVLNSNNIAKGISNYAEKIGADMILAHPEAETKIGWPGRHISDILPASSAIQVWAV